MQRIRVSSLRAGQAFDKSLFYSTGQKMLGANVTLSARHIEAIQRCGEVELLLAEDVQELVEAGLLDRFDGSRLSIGQTLRQEVITSTGRVLLEAGQEVEEHHLDALAAAGGALMPKKPTASERRERILAADTLVEALDQKTRGLDLRVRPASSNDWIQPRDAAEWPSAVDLTTLRNAAVARLRDLYARIEAGLAVEVEAFDPMIDDLVQRLSQHPTRFTQIALQCPRKEDYLPDHAYTSAVLAMATAAQLNWPLPDVRRAGLAGLLFDLGMLLVPERIRVGANSLTDIDRSRVHRHPVFSLAMLETVERTETIIKLAAVQHHERENGSGYPRGLRRDAICDLARLMAVTDSFAATTEPRHYRRPKLPYVAMEELLRSTSTLWFWKPAVRALLQATGLFPVGSFLKLSDGRGARVVAANPTRVDRPTVQPVDMTGKDVGGMVDLAAPECAELTIVRPMSGPTG